MDYAYPGVGNGGFDPAAVMSCDMDDGGSSSAAAIAAAAAAAAAAAGVPPHQLGGPSGGGSLMQSAGGGPGSALQYDPRCIASSIEHQLHQPSSSSSPSLYGPSSTPSSSGTSAAASSSSAAAAMAYGAAAAMSRSMPPMHPHHQQYMAAQTGSCSMIPRSRDYLHQPPPSMFVSGEFIPIYLSRCAYFFAYTFNPFYLYVMLIRCY